jgi:hypothetical protein
MKTLFCFLLALALFVTQAVAGFKFFKVDSDDADGSNYVHLPTFACKQVTLLNTSGTAIEIRRHDQDDVFVLPNNTSYVVKGITNAEQVQFRRQDTSDTLVTIYVDAADG